MSPRRGALCGALVFAMTASAQVTQAMGSISGVVIDARTQNPVPEAVVTAKSPAMLGEQAVVTDEAGAFEITLLPVGTYALNIQRKGFQPFAPEGLLVRARRNVKIRLQMLPEEVEQPVEFTDAMAPPQMLSGPDIEYNDAAIEHGSQGLLVARCIVSLDGSVHDCKLLKGVPYMDRTVIEALQRRRYKPASLKGRPVAVLYTFNVRLTLPQQ